MVIQQNGYIAKTLCWVKEGTRVTYYVIPLVWNPTRGKSNLWDKSKWGQGRMKYKGAQSGWKCSISYHGCCCGRMCLSEVTGLLHLNRINFNKVDLKKAKTMSIRIIPELWTMWFKHYSECILIRVVCVYVCIHAHRIHSECILILVTYVYTHTHTYLLFSWGK